MALRVTTAPRGTLISLREAKAQCDIDFADSDERVYRLIRTAQDKIEAEVQRRYLAQSVDWICETWPAGRPFPLAGYDGFAHMTVNSVKYTDLTGAQQTLPPDQYWAKPVGQTLKLVPRWFVVWPWLGDAAERVVINMSFAGDASTVPDTPKHACAMLISHWNQNRDAVVGVDNRDSSTEIPQGIKDLLWDQRWEAC